ncbi:hypothetical protein AQUCO_00200827v1 [Aquilegia coerulea]|uniref:DYW domain-containing protein n=1 Tax=Aquilegia coerulea TaxID=218851 RepID=A0A2G5F594_AQUCA|nr:hypothetical protein AQUCO_00200827v1 [Aquilegia coerulea]PIA63057.1 hypothetical protein AQUCO_00200827v1 [Aquilegia coerulea]
MSSLLHRLPPYCQIHLLKHVQAHLIRFGLNQDNYLINMLLKSTLQLGNPTYARVIFYQLEEPNIFLWNTMIQGFVINNRHNETIEFYGLMRKEGLFPNNMTFPFVLKACAKLLDLDLGVKIHTYVLKAGLDFDMFVKTSLLSIYAKCGYVKEAHLLFDEIPVKNVVSWTAIISGYIGVGRYSEAVDLFRRMLEMNLTPDSFTIVRVLSACSQLGDSRNGEWIHRYISNIGMGRNVFVATSLLDMYCKCGNMEKARVVFDETPEKDVVVWGAMICGYASNGLPKEAVELFIEMQSKHVKPDSHTVVGVLSACARLGALELGERVNGLIDKNELLLNPIVGTALIDMYAKCGNIMRAWKIFDAMMERDLVLWNAMISGLAMNGHIKAAFGLFAQMEKMGIQPDGNTFIGLLCGCTHAGLVDEGRRYFDSIHRVYSLIPKIEHYGCMVDLLGRAGLLTEAHQLIKDMPFKANSIVWGALLGGCRIHKDTQLAEHVLKQLIELEPWNSGNYVLLTNIFSVTGRWDDAAKMRLIMNERGLQKSPASSWIEVDGVVHEFRVGDQLHPLSEEIYAKLEELGQKLKGLGYTPMTDFVMFDIDEEEKESSLGCHSEKLAIAFGLIRSAPGALIRVVKNLRVCGDCHTAITLISKVTGREIIVRDNNRFHCFKDGSCSCNNYW